MASLKIGVLGFGFIGAIHARAAENCTGTELGGVWTLQDNTAENFRKLYPDIKLYSSPEEMAADPDIDAVAIGTPNSLHSPQARLFLEAGKHVLVEKPMAMSVGQGEEMANLALEKNLRLMTGHMWRFDREVTAVRDMLAKGEIGEVVRTKGYGIHENWGLVCR